MRPEDVSFLMTRLHHYAYMWRDVGTALNFQHAEMENIRHSFPTATTRDLLHELLSQWSQWPTTEHSQDPTMERLCDALRSSLVELGAPASELFENRGNLPSLTKCEHINLKFIGYAEGRAENIGGT